VTLALLLLLLTLVILTLSVGRERRLTRVEKAVIYVLAPAQKVVMRAVDSVSGLVHRYFFLIDTAEENARLRAELSRLNQELVLYRESHLANRRLRRMLEFKEGQTLSLVAAEVIALDPSGWFKTILVDKGSQDGITAGMAVVNADGVIGRIIDVSYRHSKVLLLIDRSSAVDALIQRSRAKGILKGSPEGVCRLEFVIRNADVQEGDTVITSGLAGAFPKGLLLGRVGQVERAAGSDGLFQKIVVEPAVDFERLEEVLIALRPNPFLSEKSRD